MKWSDLLLPSPKYATHDLSTKWEGTMSPGFLYPVYSRLMLPGDKFKINLRHLIRTNPTLSPLFSSFKVRFVTVVSNLKNYAIGVEGYRRSFDWRTMKLPHFAWLFPEPVSGRPIEEAYPADVLPRIGTRETSLGDYLGYPRGWFPCFQQYKTQASAGTYVLEKSALPFLVYYDFYRNYLVNPQSLYFPIVRPNLSSNVLIGKPYVTSVSLSALDSFFEDVHTYYDGVNTSAINSSRFPDFPALFGPYGYNPASYVADPSYKHTWSVYHGGLVSTLYDPDMNNQWMSYANYQNMESVRVNLQSNSLLVDDYVQFSDIVRASSIWQFLTAESFGDGTFANHIYSQYGLNVKSDMNIPQIVHVTDSLISFEDITSQSDTQETGGSPVGKQFGVGRSYGSSNSFVVRNTDNNYAMLMTFCWITPNVRYATGISPDSNIVKLSDIFVPAFDNYSLQPLFQEQYYALPIANGDYMNATDESPNIYGLYSTGALNDAIRGYQPAFTEYKTDVDRVHGLLKSSLSYWTIVRNFPVMAGSASSGFIDAGYVHDAVINSYLAESDSRTYDTVFSIDDFEDNFQTQIKFDITAIRPISKSAIPSVK